MSGGDGEQDGGDDHDHKDDDGGQQDVGSDDDNAEQGGLGGRGCIILAWQLNSALWQHRDLQKMKNKKSKHQFEKFELQKNQNIKQGPGLAIPYFPFLKKKLNLPH